MTKKLKAILKHYYANRLINYGNVAYQRISNDWHFEHIPDELRELWYGQDVVSFITMSSAYSSGFDCMSKHELVRLIDNEYNLIVRLETIFANLNKKKGGEANET